MVERTAKALADGFDPILAKTRGKANLCCESEDEAVLLAHELKKRGYRAHANKAIQDSFDKLTVVDVVCVTGRTRKGESDA